MAQNGLSKGGKHMEWVLGDLENEDVALWSHANPPTQQMYGISVSSALNHLKALYLLADRVAVSTSSYFESEITQAVVSMVKPLLLTGEVLFFIAEDIEDFTEHGLRKLKTSPPGQLAYSDADTIGHLANLLNAHATTLRRPSGDISARIVELWTNDTRSVGDGSLGALLSHVKPSDRDKAQKAIRVTADRRRGDFVWEYVGPQLIDSGFPAALARHARRRLSQLYVSATAEALNASLDAPQHASRNAALTGASRHDTALFRRCMKCADLLHILEAHNAFGLAKVKQSPGWQEFRALYFDLIRFGANDMCDIQSLASENVNLGQPLTRYEFVRAFDGVLRVVGQGRGWLDSNGLPLGERFGLLAGAIGDHAHANFAQAVHRTAQAV